MTKIIEFVNNLRIRSKLLGAYTIAFLSALLVGGIIIIFQVQKTIQAHIESELTNATLSIGNMVETAASTSIKNHLRAVAEKNKEIVAAIYKQTMNGALTESDAKVLCRKLLFSQTIGRTGYIFCVSSQGIAAEHPQPDVAGKRFMDREFVRLMIQKKRGYLEYEWKNPGEREKRPKAMYMSYFEPWDWIIAVSSYREEFRELINVDDFRDSILKLKFGKSGYTYIIDSKGNVIVHPHISGNYYDDRDRDGNLWVQAICRMKTGRIIYSWKNPGDSFPRKKLAIFNYIPEYDWIVVSTSLLDEIYAPLNTVKTVIVAIVVLISFLVFAFSFWINASVVRPLRALMTRFDQGASGDFSVRMPVTSKDEIGQLAGYFNRFMDTLERSSRKLQEEILQRKRNEQALKLSEEMFSKAFRSSPSGMFIATLDSSKILNVNDSFLKITGHNLLDLVGQELLTLAFFQNRQEGRILLGDIKKRRAVVNREMVFLTASGLLRQGLISGEGVTLWEEACILGAMEDITESRRLEREILDISQNERQKIAMSLHDDLCPQLIGIEFMVKMLEKRLGQQGSGLKEDTERTHKIRELILDAIEKTRNLSRGLSPVNLEDRRFDDSLEDLVRYVKNVFRIECALDSMPDQGISPLFKDNNIATHVYYIAHEAVHNAAKHADCTRIRICLDKYQGRIRLTITDNGSGFDPAISHTGLGIRIMSYRAARIGGKLSIDRAGQTGTRVCLELPVLGDQL
ncbi:cache domain-containing protein [uncultured Desulfobacter sp.]|uniref:cache domain-containing protein n=1 Tax=uncultured Desulfobacter sp. TaxID=240139 RepID=UPI002AAAD82C|nr:cache domain-containing protein [uncultured Desulfobacter sp.]